MNQVVTKQAANIDLAAMRAVPIGAQVPEHHGTYVGIMRGDPNEPDYHLILADGGAEDMTHDQAIAWAKSINADLPTRREQRLLFANAKALFYDGDWYWSAEQTAGLSDFAWFQDFSNGDQSYSRKSHECRARAVRRIPIEATV